MRTNHTVGYFLTACVAALGFAGCGGNDCGTGTEESGGTCQAAISCGPGTDLRNGQCEPSASGLNCDLGTTPNSEGTACVPSADACTPPTQFDSAARRCISGVTCGSGTTLLGNVCVLACEGEFEARVTTTTTTGVCAQATRVQIVHAVGDAGLGLVDVWAAGELVFEDLAFGAATPVLKLPVGERIRITEAGQAEDAPFLASDTDVTRGVERTLAVLRGTVSTSGISTPQPLTLDFRPGLREEPDATGEAQFSLYHAVPDAPAVGVGVQDEFDTVPAAPIYSNIAYGAQSPYVALPQEDTAAVDVYAQSSGMRVASVQTSSGSELAVGAGLGESAGVLVAMGFLNPEANTGSGTDPGAPLRVVAVLPDGTALPLDAAARVQLVHGAVAFPQSISVIFQREAGNTPGMEVADLTYQEATPFQTYVAGTPTSVLLGSGAGAEQVAEPTLAFGAKQRWVIVEDPVLSATIAIATVERERAESGVDIQVLHASSDAGPVDVHFHQSLSPGMAELSNPVNTNLMFPTAGATVEGRTFEDIVVSLTELGETDASIVDFNVGLNTINNLAEAGDALAFIVTGSAEGSPMDLELVVVGADGERGDPIGGQ